MAQSVLCYSMILQLKLHGVILHDRDIENLNSED